MIIHPSSIEEPFLSLSGLSMLYIQQIFEEFLQCTSNPGSCPHETDILISNEENLEEYNACTKVKVTVIRKCMEGISIPNFMAHVKAAGDVKET